MLQGASATALCASLAKFDAGCCAGALFNTLGLYYQLTCNAALSAAFLAFAASGCAANGPGLSPCAGYLAPEIEAHPAVDCQGLSLPPASCASIPKGQCPQDSCEFLWCAPHGPSDPSRRVPPARSGESSREDSFHFSR